jgi:hypothetical protein
MAPSTAVRPAGVKTREESVMYLVSWTDGGAAVALLPGSLGAGLALLPGWLASIAALLPASLAR